MNREGIALLASLYAVGLTALVGKWKTDGKSQSVARGEEVWKIGQLSSLRRKTVDQIRLNHAGD